jgi:Cu2+-exporting ATPase
MFRERFWLSLALTVPILYLAPQVQSWLGYQALHFPGAAWLSPLLAIILYFYGGWPFVRGAGRELKSGQPGMMALIALAITVAFFYSLAVSLGLSGMPFYWELATLIDVMLLGHWLEMASVQGASAALKHLASLVPATAHKLLNGEVTEVAVAELREGDHILIRPGEQIPADGQVIEGGSSVNEAFLTGELRPVPKQEGGEVVAGAVNGEGALTVEVTRTGDATALSQIQRLVEEAQASRSRFQTLADRAAAYLAYIAVGAGIVAFVVWLLVAGNLEAAMTRAVTVLVIACPHALGLAIPLVIVNATSMSARHGILVRNREAFERARELKLIAFDKTGTLTQGKFGVREVVTEALTEEEALRLAAGLETRSEHPLAEAIVSEAGRRGLGAAAVKDFEVIAGRGVKGRLEGKAYRVGQPEWLAAGGLEPHFSRVLAGAEARGESVIALADESGVLALFALADQPRPGAKEAIAKLKALGLEPVMVTGDAEAVANTVAAELGIEHVYARVLPQEKADVVKRLKQQGPLAFVGDGINDAPALLEADLGIAIGAGTNVAIESADLVLTRDDPRDVAAALKLAKASYGKMVQNLFWATGYNAFAIPLAGGVLAGVGILLSPAVGALLMSLSTVIVAANAMLLRRVKLA